MKLDQEDFDLIEKLIQKHKPDFSGTALMVFIMFAVFIFNGCHFAK